MKLFIAFSTSCIIGIIHVSGFSPSISSPSRQAIKNVQSSFDNTAFGLQHSNAFAIKSHSGCHRQSTQLFMGWGPEPVWSTATVTSNSPACPSQSCVSLTIEVPSEVKEGYVIPGQYVQMKSSIDDEDAKPIFLAIASPPSKPEDDNEESSTTMEFLIKKTDNNSWITSALASSTVAISQVMGSGFPMEENLEGFKYDFPTQNVLLFANGSGIAPIRAAIESGQLNIAPAGKGGRTARLYYGVQTLADMPYAEKFGRWELDGVQVVPVLSRPEDCKDEWNGRTGYVQNALEEDGISIPRNSGALLCGVQGMAESVKDLLLKAGVFEGRVLTNF